MIAQITRAVLLASATVTTRTGFRDNRSASFGSTAWGLSFARRTSEVMPTTSSRRKYLSPIFDILPSRSLPPLECCSGVRPSQAANCRPERNWCGSVTEAAKAVAQMVPPAGIVASRLDGFLLDHPSHHLGRAISGVADQ